MRLTLAYQTINGESREVFTNVATIVKWERLMKRKISTIGEAIGAEDLCFFAYEATRQAGIVVPSTLDLFIDQLADMPEVVEGDNPNPTDAGSSAIS